MLSNPRIGQRVRLHYAEKKRPLYPYHGLVGVVEVRGKGRPRNHLVRLDDGRLVVVPGGNLTRESL